MTDSIRLALPLAVMLVFAAGCSDGFCPESCGDPYPELVPQTIPAPTSPENVIEAIEVIYNDRIRSAPERSQAYARLLDPAFVFHVQAGDVAKGLPESWGLDQELAAHSGMFNALESGDIYSLEIRILHDAAINLIPPEPGGESWKKVFATNVYLRLMFNLHDGLEVNGGQAEFIFPPAQHGQWKIGAWLDLPIPAAQQEMGEGSRGAVAASTWGRIKYNYAVP